jgi:hypothetical protein
MWTIARYGLVGVLVLAMLGGCSFQRRGITGVRLDSNGDPVLILGLCKDFGSPRKLAFYEALDDQGDVGDVLLTLTYHGKSRATYIEIPLADLPDGWTADRQPPELSDSRSYVIRAWNGDGSDADTVQGFTFAPSAIPDSDADRPILYRERTGNDFTTRRLDKAGFQKAATAYCAKSG